MNSNHLHAVTESQTTTCYNSPFMTNAQWW